MLEQQIAASTYLNWVLASNKDLNGYIGGKKPVNESCLEKIINELEDSLAPEKTKQRITILRRAKQRFALLWSIAELSEQLSFAALSKLQCAFADKSIHVALDIAWHSPRINKLLSADKQVSPESSGLFVLALGKLGGYDLNFSSDIDLIAFYDKSLLKVAPMQGASYVVSQCLQMMTKILSEPSEDGFVWRVDWRLRPYASLRNLSMTTDKALDFYHYSARPWHRLAMLKARAVAGNIRLADGFLADMQSFLWRYNLDYRAIDDIAQLKTKINLAHPALQSQREQDDITLDKGHGFNLKLGHGGIREIEFVANALQLLWGGRKPALRTTNTLDVLTALEEEGLLTEQERSQLTAAYVFLRKTENHLQMLDNEQAYHLPNQEGEMKRLLTLNQVEDWAKFNAELSQHRQNSFRIFQTLFSEQEKAQSIVSALIWQAADLKEDVQQIVLSWEEGFVAYGVLEGQAHLFETLLQALSDEIKLSGCEINYAIKDIDDYFRRLPPGGQYFRLLRDYPWLLQKLITPLLLSPTMAELLRQSPHIIDRFLEGATVDENGLDTTIVFASSDYETRLENLRRITNEELYLRYSLYFESKLSPHAFQQSLTRLAERLLSLSLQIACDEMQIEKAPIAIIGFGKLGDKGMMPKSDLDLVYLCESIDDHALAGRFAARLNTIINTPMREGRVYELDTRLRPSGQSGSATISLDSYARHQETRAHTWSHLALVPARFIAGSQFIGSTFEKIKASILAKPRDVEQFKNDAAKMLKRVRDQKGILAKGNQFTAKQRAGGLFELEYLLNCEAVLAKGAHKDKKTQQAHECLQILQLEIRLFGRDGATYGELPAPILTHVLAMLNCADVDALIEKVEWATKLTNRRLDEFFKDINWSAISDWDERNVNWLDTI